MAVKVIYLHALLLEWVDVLQKLIAININQKHNVKMEETVFGMKDNQIHVLIYLVPQ